jgi:hypothetical protein
MHFARGGVLLTGVATPESDPDVAGGGTLGSVTVFGLAMSGDTR